MKLLLINPNTSSAMTSAIGQAARAVAGPGTEVVAVQPSFGPASIECHYDEAFAAAGVAEQVRLALAWQPDAVVIACFGDPGLDAAREATGAPVVGVAEAAFHAATLLATSFSVVTTLSRTCITAERLLQRYGFERHCRGVHGTDIPVLDLNTPPKRPPAASSTRPATRWHAMAAVRSCSAVRAWRPCALSCHSAWACQ